MRITKMGLMVCCMLLAALPAAAQPVKSTAEYKQRLEKGIEAFYCSHWQEAGTIFRQLQERHPADARAYFFESMIPFWQYYFGGKKKSAATSFLKRSQKALAISHQQLEANPHDTTMVLMLSGLYGYRSLVAAAEEEYRTAIQSGMEGFSYTRQLLALNASDPKALIGKGIFYYMMGSVPSQLKWLTNMAGLSGDMAQGFRALERAARSGSYVSNDAKMILAYLYEREHKIDKAIHHLQDLVQRYPQNIIFQYNLAQLYDQKGRIGLAKKKYKLVSAMPDSDLKILKKKSRQRLQHL